jgi:uncharacterized membrane protein
LGPRIVKEHRGSPRKIDAAVAAVIAFDRATVGRVEAEQLVRNSLSKAVMGTYLQIAGSVAITLGVSLMFIPAGLIVGGVFLVLFGLAAERK